MNEHPATYAVTSLASVHRGGDVPLRSADQIDAADAATNDPFSTSRTARAHAGD